MKEPEGECSDIHSSYWMCNEAKTEPSEAVGPSGSHCPLTWQSRQRAFLWATSSQTLPLPSALNHLSSHNSTCLSQKENPKLLILHVHEEITAGKRIHEWINEWNEQIPDSTPSTAEIPPSVCIFKVTTHPGPLIFEHTSGRRERERSRRPCQSPNRGGTYKRRWCSSCVHLRWWISGTWA